MRHLLLMCLACIGILYGENSEAHAQISAYGVVYRPPGTKYYVLRREHFDIIYERGRLREALETGQRLAATLAKTDSLVGSNSRLQMPVIINGFNDRANGFVAPFPFRQELEAVSIKGTGLSPRFESWIETVAPHELVHAVHANYRNGFGVIGVLHWFVPDLARSLNLTVPKGIAEGAAVLRESEIEPGAGRLNHSFFNMEFRAAMLSKHPWSLAQMLQRPAYTRPFDRFYHGGSHLFSYLIQTGESDFFRRANNLHNRFPFFGYGIDLWYGTHTSPQELEREFQQYVRKRASEKIAELGRITVPVQIAGKRGTVYRRPQWLNDSTLVAYVRGYDLTPGFYRINLGTGKRSLIHIAQLTEDQRFALSPDKSSIIYSRYVQDPFVPSKSNADVYLLNLATRRESRLSRNARAQAPYVTLDGTIWAFCDDGQYNHWCRILENRRTKLMTDWPRTRFIALGRGGGVTAVILNLKGRQAIFRARKGRDGKFALSPLLSFEDGSIYDLTWSSDGRYLLFTADPGGIPNIFTLDNLKDRVYKLSNMAFGSMDPAVSPDGRTVAFVSYQNEEYDLVKMPFRPSKANEVNRDSTRFLDDQPWREWLNEKAAPLDTVYRGQPYHSFRYLKPRMLYPTIRYENHTYGPGDTRLGWGFGIATQGADPLQRWAYSAELFRQKNSVWGSVLVQTSASVLRPYIRISRVPNTVLVRQRDIAGTALGIKRLGREKREIEAGAIVPVTIEDNAYRTTATLSLRGEYRQEQLFGNDGKRLTSIIGRTTLRPAALLAYRIQSNPRDLIPNSGLTIGLTSELDATVSEKRFARRRALVSQVIGYLPFLKRKNIGLRFTFALLNQNEGSIFNLDRFVPRGYEDAFIGRGTFIKAGFEYLHPLIYLDKGPLLLPIFFKAFYAYAFAESLQSMIHSADRLSSAGTGLGLRMRLFYLINLDLRLGAAYLIERNGWDVVYR